MELVRQHRKIGRVVGSGHIAPVEEDGIGVRAFVRVEWNDWTVTAEDRASVKPCGPAGVQDWALQSMRDIVGHLQRIGVENAPDLVRAAMEQLEKEANI